jgi:hypothetical protein
VDKIVCDNLARQGMSVGQFTVEQIWSRNRNFDMIFVSPSTLLLAIVHSQIRSAGFKKFSGVLYYITAIASDEHNAILKQVAGRQHNTISDAAKVLDDLRTPVPVSTRIRYPSKWQVIMTFCVIGCSITLIERAAHTQSVEPSQLICHQLQISSADQSLGIWAPNTSQSESTPSTVFFSSMLAMIQPPTMVICAMISSTQRALWYSNFSTPSILAAIQKAKLYSMQLLQ